MANDHAANPTLLSFGYPQSLVREYRHWAVLARPKQATLGALVLVCKEAAQAYSAIGSAAFGEQERVIGDIERGLAAFCRFDKINYLMLMMVDREVHYHVLPRYAEPRRFGGRDYHDAGWPAVPDLSAGPALAGDELTRLVGALRAAWPGDAGATD